MRPGAPAGRLPGRHGDPMSNRSFGLPDRLPSWVRTAIERTCTPGFARYLLAQPARPTALQAAHPKAIETYRVAGVEPAGAPDTVAVSYVSAQDSADTGELLLRLVREHGRW